MNGKRSIFIMVIVLTIGVVFGSFLANLGNLSKVDKLRLLISDFIEGYTLNLNNKVCFYESFIKYGKIVLILWFSAFAPLCLIIIFIMIFVRGLSFGFTSSVIIKIYGLKGILYCICLFLIQNIILIPVYFFVSYYSLNFSQKIREEKESFKERIKEYAFVLVIAAFFVLLASLIDSFVSPLFMKYLL